LNETTVLTKFEEVTYKVWCIKRARLLLCTYIFIVIGESAKLGKSFVKVLLF